MVLGIPTVKRQYQSYLVSNLPLFTLEYYNPSFQDIGSVKIYQTVVGHHPAVCPGEHDVGGDGGHSDHHLHR